MKYNEKYDRWVSKDGLVYRYDKNNDKLILCGNYPIKINGYIRNNTKIGSKLQHIIVWETFNGKIPDGYQIDHINTIRTDNRLENLRIVTHKENCNNPLSRKHLSEAHKGTISTEFGHKFKEHFGINSCENPKLYNKEKSWYHTHNHTCRWE